MLTSYVIFCSISLAYIHNHILHLIIITVFGMQLFLAINAEETATIIMIHVCLWFSLIYCHFRCKCWDNNKGKIEHYSLLHHHHHLANHPLPRVWCETGHKHCCCLDHNEDILPTLDHAHLDIKFYFYQ